MNTFDEHFPGKVAVVLPVIHVCRESHHIPMKNVDLAFDAGAHGVFVINHGFSAGGELFPLICRIRDKYPNNWVGANFLGYSSEEVFYPWPPPYVDGVWSDDLRRIPREAVTFDGLYFGAFAFKTGPQVPNSRLKEFARVCAPHTDVLTTSGAGTGKQPSVKKIRKIREAIGVHPLAIASGVTPENVEGFLPYTNAFLVATGISKDFENLDEAKTKKFVRIVEEWNYVCLGQS